MMLKADNPNWPYALREGSTGSGCIVYDAVSPCGYYQLGGNEDQAQQSVHEEHMGLYSIV
jgi:hypothetical protein